ncbi:MAG TPA: excinuclease ABC subunit C [Acidobacteriaceae bacterium]|nr:excinuclease ABC subunit C [Acidobacteriaceae bacterium]
MGVGFEFERRVEFAPERATEILREIPAAPGVVCLRGHDEAAQPYLTRAADVRRRLRRLLDSPDAVDEAGRPVLSKRLNLRERVRWIEWTRTGSEFESTVVLYCAARASFGPAEARRRLRLHAPFVLRMAMSNEHPRVYVTNKLNKRSLAEAYGPFASRAAAERYCEAVLDLFKLRRCWEDLEVSPEHPGCAYGEMKMCMEPCKGACTREEYAAEAERVRSFLETNGESMLAELAAKREAASEAMDFEGAAAAHKQWEKVKAATALADEIVQPLMKLRALIVQAAAPTDEESAREAASVFAFEQGRIVGPERLSTLGVRAVKEQTAVGSSLFAQPLMIAAVPLDQPSEQARRGPRDEASQQVSESASQGAGEAMVSHAALNPEERARGVIARLEERVREAGEPQVEERCDYLSLLRRWYYRPEKQRAGAILFPNPDGAWPVRRLLNAAAREALGPPREAAAVDREAAKEMKTRVLHPGREGVERVVPLLPKRARRKKGVLPENVPEE